MKKTFVKFLTCILIFALCLSAVPVYAAETADRVEIAFKLGESTLTINGNAVQVETPYAVGVGVTLVPVRVITEAFGAVVGWDGTTQSIPIEYQGVEILLQIGNPIAEVNGIPETLLASPEISGQSTMVPLRFISETFGAVVGYDSVTGAVTVTKEASAGGSTLEGSIDSLRVGDSHYGWSMENPSNMTLDRGFDGGYTYFEYDESSWIGILVDKLPEDYSFEEDFSSMKSVASQYTLVAAEKETKDPNVKKYYIKFKDKVDTYEEYVYVANGYRFNAYYEFSNELKDEQTEASRILATFKPSFTKEDTHDLSNVKNGYRTYESEGMKFSISVPDDFTIASNEDVENDVSFASTAEKDKYSVVNFSVYSKSEVGSAKELCDKDYETNKRNSNEDISRFASIKEVSYAGFSGYEYSFNYNGESVKATMTDSFFEVGDYTYNVSVMIDQEVYSNCENIIQAVLNSVKVQALDPEETGILMRYEPDSNAVYTIKGDKWSVKVPEIYEKQTAADDYAVISDKYTGTTISISVADVTGTRSNSDLVEDLKELEDLIRDDGDCKVIFQTQKTTAGAYTYNTMAFKTHEKDSMMVYTYVFSALRGGKEINIMVMVPEIGFSANTRATYADIAANLVIEP